jgi:hypothetical protein
MKKLIPVMLVLGLMIVAANRLSAQNACSKEVDGKKVNFKVVNNTTKPLVVNFVNHQCREVSSNSQIAAGATTDIFGYNGHVFRVREFGTKNLLKEIVANPSNPPQIVIGSVTPNNATPSAPAAKPQPNTAGNQPSAGPTYWLPTVQRTPTITNYTYNVRVPDYMVPWILQQTERGGGQTVAKPINGKSYTFVQQGLTWDTNGSSPARTGQIRIDNLRERGRSNLWKSDSKLKDDRAVIGALDSAALPNPSSPWREVDLLVLRSDGVQPPNLRFSEAVPLVDQVKANQLKLAEQTRAGSYFPDMQVPVNLAAFRNGMLKLGNLGRNNPDYRKGNQYASDFRGENAVTNKGREKIYKNNPAPPYFKELTLDPKLNEACQFQAEYQATIGRSTHDGPTNYNGVNLSTFSLRLKHFAPNVGTAGEGAGGPASAFDYPESWMKSETHYRPWFSIGADVRTVGLGAAKGRDGKWYFCMIGGTVPPGTP